MPLTFHFIGGPRRARIFTDLVKMQISVYILFFACINGLAKCVQRQESARKYEHQDQMTTKEKLDQQTQKRKALKKIG